MTERIIGLVGNPNCGKTTLFNALTGARQKVGNWPGVTVEKKTGIRQHGDCTLKIVDLPGTYALHESEEGPVDEQIASYWVRQGEADILLNIIDATALERGLMLTTQLLETGCPVVVAVNMMDALEHQGLHLDTGALSRALGCRVIPVVATRKDGLERLLDALCQDVQPVPATPWHEPVAECETPDLQARYLWISQVCDQCLRTITQKRTDWTERMDRWVLHRLLGIPFFLLVMYLMFLVSVNLGSAFIDLFDGVAGALFVEGTTVLLKAIHAPDWLVALLAQGVGSGVQLVASFIPVIASLFLCLSLLEGSGYMARAAFVIERAMNAIGLPGKAFVPLIVGFGCNVPAIMATRTLDRGSDRLVTTLMAPFMSCSARLTVYALFAAAFFPTHGQNVVFGLYLLGILMAIGTGFLVRRYLLPGRAEAQVMEMPRYHLPGLRYILTATWHRLHGFVMRAGKAIVVAVTVLNLLASFTPEGGYRPHAPGESLLAEVGRTLTPAFAPMGLTPDNWPATVGIFTGVFAKEVVVGTLDTLYRAAEPDEVEVSGWEAVRTGITNALASVPTNLSALSEQMLDPLGLSSASADAANSDRAMLGLLREGFHTTGAALAYLVFILLYTPCLATLGAMVREQGSFWAGFAALWTLSVAYAVAVWVYQASSLADHVIFSAGVSLTISLALVAVWRLMVWVARPRAVRAMLIPVELVTQSPDQAERAASSCCR